MVFNSAVFILLFFLFYLIYWPLPVKWKHDLIIFASFLFYGWFSLKFLLFFMFLILVNYYVALILLEKKSKPLLAAIIIVDSGSLIFFKYFYLIAESAGYLIQKVTGYSYLVNLKANWIQDHDFEIVLPIAISFYTFQIIAWVVDSYRGTITEKISLKRFCVFILFFPQFIAGPIMRATDFIPQIDHPIAEKEKMLNGSLLILMGVFKKVLIADQIGALTNEIWASPSSYDASLLILLLPSFAVRIYCDFSGYTDMARGLAKILGYEIPENFRGPLISRSISELWRRWHITLSSWLRDYTYIPMGGSRTSEMKTSLNLLVTMALAGIWHGASWTMLLWGIYMGVFMVIERFFAKRNFKFLPDSKSWDIVRIVWTFFIFSSSALLFATPDLEHTAQIIRGVLTFQNGKPIAGAETLIGLTVIGFIMNYLQVSRLKSILQKNLMLQYALIPVSLLFIGFLVNLYGDISASFIYFSF